MSSTSNEIKTLFGEKHLAGCAFYNSEFCLNANDFNFIAASIS
ncbi:hypothetical protein Tsp_07183 [Trichinella spiralis]|nr:hypothetical protein Tsp_07183 [Trichinella spiralis]